MKFLYSIDPASRELYILHREWPACLIHVLQETPARFIVEDLYDELEDHSTILTMPFVEEAKQFFKDYVAQIQDPN